MNYDPVAADPINIDPNNPPGMRPVVISSEGEKLYGTLFLASGPEEKPTAILLHGFPGNENNFDIAHAVCRNGWNALVFYYRGTWGSKGLFSWSNAIADVHNVLKSMREGIFSKELKVDSKKLVLIGHSMGGFFATHALVKDLCENVFTYGIFNIGFVGELIGGNELFEKMAMESIQSGSIYLNVTSPEQLLKEMIDKSGEWNLISYAQKIAAKNFYTIGGSKDQTAPLDLHYTPLVNVLKKHDAEKRFGEIYETGHSFSDKRIALTKRIITWLNEIKF